MLDNVRPEVGLEKCSVANNGSFCLRRDGQLQHRETDVDLFDQLILGRHELRERGMAEYKRRICRPSELPTMHRFDVMAGKDTVGTYHSAD